ncbi:MAG: hypothetical protein U1C58_12325 [Flavobacteriaceae bacterium]|nr:hypothetical protein [Flavobacteriaceae bacterium]
MALLKPNIFFINGQWTIDKKNNRQVKLLVTGYWLLVAGCWLSLHQCPTSDFPTGRQFLISDFLLSERWFRLPACLPAGAQSTDFRLPTFSN